MIWLQEGNSLTKNQISSVNDDKLREYIETFGELSSPENLIPTMNEKGIFACIFPHKIINEGSEYVINEILEENRDGYIVLSRFHRFRKWLTLKMAKAALACDTKYTFELSKYFLAWEQDLDKISSIVGNPYFSEFMQSMYGDYDDFVSILPCLAIEPIREYDVRKLEQISALNLEQGLKTEEVEDILNKQESAKANSQILQKAKLLTRSKTDKQ